MTSQTEPVYP